MALYFYQTRLIFKPTLQLTQTPEEQQLDYEEVWISPEGKASPGQGLHGWWLPGLQGNLADYGLTLLYLHGNSENIGANLGLAHRYQRMGFNVLLVDYRGYGQSMGPFPNEQRVYDDAIAAYRYLAETHQIPAQQIWVFGHSLGGAIAIELSTQRSMAGLIVQSTFSSMLQAVQFSGQYNWVPVNWILTQRFDSIAKVPQLEVPVLYIHGLEDDTTAAVMSEQLYKASPLPKQLWLVPEAGHNNVADTAGLKYVTTVETFVEQMQPTVAIQAPASPVE
ncbi:alpha/beta hydrolase [Leptolyngbya sp. Heron Island J]|uniref:alpha/beta hydrolase n=1 Tax=Leptolyngbya sp. Heron Island J TaxID=1385935 RepID=UPI00041A2765|nr:alpha/beta hydrolase [Leptolyngbya sp. Heron Island J]